MGGVRTGRIEARFACAVAVLVLAAFTSTIAAGPAAADERIVGGTTTTIEKWPWQVAIAEPGEGSAFERFFCGGSLVAPKVVVTAAHCTDLDLDGRFDEPPSDFSVVAGRSRLSSSAGGEVGVREYFYFVDAGGEVVPEAQTAHGEGDAMFDPGTLEWDAVVLELASAAPAPAAPIAIAGEAEAGAWQPGDPAFITGWGTTAFGGLPSDTLREAEVEIIDDETCGSLLFNGPLFFEETMVCAGFETGLVDTCQGDSGGPLVVPIGDGTFRLVGDTSWGIGCALPTKPGVYGRVADDPMRSAIEALLLELAPPVAGGDTDPPETTITKHPKKNSKKKKAKFKFTANEPATFECKLDKKPFKACSSPFKKKVRRGRKHTFKVRATDTAGNVDPTPARFKWKVKRKR